MLKIRRSHNRLIFNMGIPIPGNDVLYIEAGPCSMFHSVQYIPRNMHTVFALLCFVVVIHWLIFPYPSGLLHWHCGNLTIAPVPAKQPWWIWINTSCEFIMNDCITTTKQSTTKPCAYFLGYTVHNCILHLFEKGCISIDYVNDNRTCHLGSHDRVYYIGTTPP